MYRVAATNDQFPPRHPATKTIVCPSIASWITLPIPVWALVLLALLFHGALLAAHVPADSFDANFHMSMASHYAHHWFNPWNEKSFAGFSQATYPPLTHQWIAMLSFVVGLENAFMVVEGIVLLLLPLAIYRYAKIWVPKREASYAAFCSIFVGALCLLAYLDGQIGTIASTTLFLLSLPFLYEYLLHGSRREFVLGLSLLCTAAAAHHATLIFGTPFLAVPVVWTALQDYRRQYPQGPLSAPVKRFLAFLSCGVVGISVVLLPYILALLRHPITEVIIPHTSRLNYVLNPTWGIHYFVVPFGPIALAIPYILYKGTQTRLRPLLFGFYFAFIFGLGGTTPLPRLLLGRAFEILTLERFAFWAILLALPFVGLLSARLIDRYGQTAALLLPLSIVGWGSFAVAWNTYFPLLARQPDVRPIIDFLNQGDHDRYRYLTLGYPNGISKITCYTNASSVDGEYNSGRTLPELTHHAVAQLTTARFYGVDGIAALSEMISHAPRYGLRYIFVHDEIYNPLLVFSGWRPIDRLDKGETIVWTTIGIPPATPIDSPLRPPRWQGLLWGIAPFGSSLITIFLFCADARRRGVFSTNHDTVRSPAL